MKVLSIQNYVEGTCLTESVEFLRDTFQLRSRFDAPATLVSAISYLRSNELCCVVRAKPLLRLRLRFAFWRSGVDVPVERKLQLADGDVGWNPALGPEANLHLVYCHYLYRLPPAEGWWHYVLDVRRGGEIDVFDSYLMRAREDFGEACVAGYPAASVLPSLSEVSVSIFRGSGGRN